ncbi:MAG: VTT domain-containing protein [Parvibaculum sp.]|nr:VTT domain-containing protein [Parvibaculum sp.]
MTAYGLSAAEGLESHEGILVPGRNVWRVERAHRARLLVDAAEYFGILRQAMCRAEHSLIIVGWDIDSRMRLVGTEGRADDGLPETLGEFLTALARKKPNLSVKLLLWDYAMFYAAERELLPAVSLRWNTPANIDLCLDNHVPLGGSHHQKIVVIDDSLAFAGGLDLTVRRWDTSAHAPKNRARMDSGGKPYTPFHDVQMMVDGSAAAALGDLARRRWQRAACETLETPLARDTDAWPEGVAPHFSDVALGIARTEPAYDGSDEVREVETLFTDLIASAERWIYIENQFLTCTRIADALAKRLREVPGLEVLIVVPKVHHSWLELRTMLAGRVRFMETLREAGVADRVRLLCPVIGTGSGAVDIMVHSKIMLADDAYLRVGSANLCNRSMGMDTECDLVVEAATDDDRTAVLNALARLVGEHCGEASDDIVATLRKTGSLFAAVDRCKAKDRCLRVVDDGDVPSGESMSAMEAIADPGRPVAAGEHFADVVDLNDENGSKGLSTIFKVVFAVLVVIGLGLLWRYTPLAGYTDPDKLRASLSGLSDGPLAALIVIAVYVLSGLIAFPVTILIAVTAATFGLWPGLLYATAGSLSSALATYGAGRALGHNMLRSLLGPRTSRISRGIEKRGIFAIMTVRLVPVAPFMLVNLVSGALRVPVLDYTAGTFLGLAPGLVLMSVLGDRVFAMMEDPSLSDIGIVLGIVVLWIALALGLQRLLSKWRASR